MVCVFCVLFFISISTRHLLHYLWMLTSLFIPIYFQNCISSKLRVCIFQVVEFSKSWFIPKKRLQAPVRLKVGKDLLAQSRVLLFKHSKPPPILFLIFFENKGRGFLFLVFMHILGQLRLCFSRRIRKVSRRVRTPAVARNRLCKVKARFFLQGQEKGLRYGSAVSKHHTGYPTGLDHPRRDQEQ